MAVATFDPFGPAVPVDEIPPAEIERAAAALAKLNEIRARLDAEAAADVIVVDVDPEIARIRAQLGLPPARPRTLPAHPGPVDLGPGAAWEAEIHRAAIARRRAAAALGRNPGRVSRKLVPTPLPIPVRCWWAVLPPSTRRSIRWPFNTARRAVVASWPIADQRNHGRAVTTAVWALCGLVAAAVALALAVIAVAPLEAVRGPWRAGRAVWRRYRARKHASGWQRYHAAEVARWHAANDPGPVTTTYTVRRRRLTRFGTAGAVALSAVIWLLVMGAIIAGGTARLEQHRAEEARLAAEAQLAEAGQ